jgi:hypothetical protein
MLSAIVVFAGLQSALPAMCQGAYAADAGRHGLSGQRRSIPHLIRSVQKICLAPERAVCVSTASVLLKNTRYVTVGGGPLCIATRS